MNIKRTAQKSITLRISGACAEPLSEGEYQYAYLMNAYVYLWDIFVCVLFMEYYLRLLAKINQCVFNLIGIFLIVFGDGEDAVADTPPHALASAGPIREAVGALCWWDMETWITHTCTAPTLEFVIFSAGYLFQVVFLGLQSCHVDIFHQLHGKTNFTFMLILKFIFNKIE